MMKNRACFVVFAISLAFAAETAHANETPESRGQYLFRAADCAACHENPQTHDLTGGHAFQLPFGTIYSTNITPDRQTGIGGYSDAQWLHALRNGIARDGKHLYPVMPYTAYTLLSDDDALAIKAYLFSLQPVRSPKNPVNSLRFPFSQRWLMMFWNWLYNPNHRMVVDNARSPAWNRGAYLAEALGHCSQCHTPRNFMYGLSSKAYAGSVQVGWLAYNLTSDNQHGLGQWDDASITKYLSMGQAQGHGAASGPMAEVVEKSLRYLSASDIAAIVTYLRAIPAQSAGPALLQTNPSRHMDHDYRWGALLFADACAGCHLPDGRGRQSDWAALGGAHSMTDPAATNIRAVLEDGTSIDTDQGVMFMHGFTRAYTAQERSAMIHYLQSQFGHIPKEY